MKNVMRIFVLAAVSIVCHAQNLVLPGNVKNFKIVRYENKYFIKLKKNQENIGRVEYNGTLKKYVSFAETEHFLGQYLYRFNQGTPEEIFN